MSREGPKLKSYMIISHCRSVLLLLTTVNWCPLFYETSVTDLRADHKWPRNKYCE